MLPEENYSCYGLVNLKVEVSWGGAEAIKDGINLSCHSHSEQSDSVLPLYSLFVVFFKTKPYIQPSNQQTKQGLPVRPYCSTLWSVFLHLPVECCDGRHEPSHPILSLVSNHSIVFYAKSLGRENHGLSRRCIIFGEMLRLLLSHSWLLLPGAEPEKLLGTFPCLLESMANSLMDIHKSTWADVSAG